MRRRSRIVLVSQLVLGLAAASTGFAGRLQLEVSAAVPGTALDVGGSGLDGTNTPVTVGGRPATVLSGDTTRVRIVVPELRPGRKPVVAQTASGKLKARLRVLRLFDGTLKVKPDRRHAAKATIGAAGGTVSTEVHGITYALDVPAGALAADTEITVTPAARIKNLPLTGEKPAAVIFAPGDLTFAIPATLRITHPGGAPANALGFTFDSGTGQAFTLVGATTSGDALELQIAHFSGGGAAGTNSQDFANVVRRELTRLCGPQGPSGTCSHALGLAEAKELVELLVHWVDTFGADICGLQPTTCDPAIRIAKDGLDALLLNDCGQPNDPPPVATLTAINEVTKIEELQIFLTSVFGADPASLDAGACRQKIVGAMVDQAINFPLRGEPVTTGPFSPSEPARELDSLPSAEKSAADLDHDGVVNKAEWLVYLSVIAQFVGNSTASGTANEVFAQAIAGVLADATADCATDVIFARILLRHGLRIIDRVTVDDQLEQAYGTTLLGCLPTLALTPKTADVAPGGKVELTAATNVRGGTSFPRLDFLVPTLAGGTFENEHAVDDNTAIGTFHAFSDAQPGSYGVAVALMLGDLNPIGSIDHDPDIPVELTDTAIVRVGCAAATGRSLSAPDVDQCTTATTATSTSTSSTTTTLACDANQCLARGANGLCEFQCDPNNCETCVNGSCVGCDRAGCEFCNEDTHACVDGCNVEGAECTFYAGGRNGSERAACCNPALEGPICILETGDPQFPFTAVCCAPDLVCCGTLTGCCPP